MEQIFESQCNEEARTVAYRYDEKGQVAIMTGPPGASFCLFLEREDAVVLARGILGMQDPPFVEWDECVHQMRMDVAEAEIRSGLAFAAIPNARARTALIDAVRAARARWSGADVAEWADGDSDRPRPLDESLTTEKAMRTGVPDWDWVARKAAANAWGEALGYIDAAAPA